MTSTLDTQSKYVELRDVSFSYSKVHAVGPISFDIHRNSVLSVIGPSGCGKTTLLYLLAGLLSPNSGRISVGGEPPTALLGTGRLGIIFQDAALLPWRSVTDNVRLPIELLRQHGAAENNDIANLLSMVGLSEFADARPRELSGGMKKRAAFARALVTRPELLLLDEPLGELDEALRVKLMFELERIWLERPTTAVLVTHNIREALFLADTIISLSPRPGTIANITELHYPKPRGRDFLKSTEFHSLYDKLIETLLNG